MQPHPMPPRKYWLSLFSEPRKWLIDLESEQQKLSRINGKSSQFQIWNPLSCQLWDAQIQILRNNNDEKYAHINHYGLRSWYEIKMGFLRARQWLSRAVGGWLAGHTYHSQSWGYGSGAMQYSCVCESEKYEVLLGECHSLKWWWFYTYFIWMHVDCWHCYRWYCAAVAASSVSCIQMSLTTEISMNE